MHRRDVKSYLSMPKGEVTQGKSLNEERRRRLVLWDVSEPGKWERWERRRDPA